MCVSILRISSSIVHRTYIYIYMHTHIYTHIFVNSQDFKSRDSNPGAIGYAHFSMPFERSHIPGAGPVFPG